MIRIHYKREKRNIAKTELALQLLLRPLLVLTKLSFVSTRRGLFQPCLLASHCSNDCNNERQKYISQCVNVGESGHSSESCDWSGGNRRSLPISAHVRA